MKKQILAGLAALGLVGAANAAVDASVTTNIATAGTDAGTVAAAVFGVIVALWAYKLLRKAL